MKFLLKLLLLLLVRFNVHTTHVHGAPFDELLHNDTNDDVAAELSVVENWLLICKQLCRSNLGGPTCGPHCWVEVEKIPISTDIHQDESTLSPSAEFCGVLCENGLGGSQCACRTGKSWTFAGYQQITGNSKQNSICSTYCRENQRQIEGCSACPLEARRYRPPVLNINRLPTIPPPRKINREAGNQQILMMQQFGNIQAETTSAMPTESTTPDWNKLCIQLCRNGQGGVLCNCDLPPF